MCKHNHSHYKCTTCKKGEVTLRDQFAMAALTGIIAANANPNSFGAELSENIHAADQAYEYADEMLKAREEEMV